jgi:hypothetical protein
MSEALTFSQERARKRANDGQQLIELAKSDVGDALEAFLQLRGFSRHYARLAKLHNDLRKLEKRIRSAVGKPVDLTAEARKWEEAKAEQLAARIREQRARKRVGTKGAASDRTKTQQSDRDSHKSRDVSKKAVARG